MPFTRFFSTWNSKGPNLFGACDACKIVEGSFEIYVTLSDVGLVASLDEYKKPITRPYLAKI